MPGPEARRLAEDTRRTRNWTRWGPYLSERQWGTVREDYSADGNVWASFPHDHARSRAYRWGEDGILGLCDREGRLCFAWALWNGRDPILKERLFGLSGTEGNHGEDVKECYYFLDGTPTGSYLRGLYKYPQRAFPYSDLVTENGRRTRQDPEYELLDTGAFAESRYFDVLVEYAKSSPENILIRLTVTNHGPDEATLDLLPTLWFRNTWAWGRTGEGYPAKPSLARIGDDEIAAQHATLGRFHLLMDRGPDGTLPALIFTENDTNHQRLDGARNPFRWVKDAFHEYLLHGNAAAVNPAGRGTKAAAHYRLSLPAGGSAVLRLRLCADDAMPRRPFNHQFDRTVDRRRAECDEFYAERFPHLKGEEARVARQASAGLIWSRQFYYYVVLQWLEGDPAQPTPPAQRWNGRNHDWTHIYNRDVISMPDTWEYPWYAAWDLAFHAVAFAAIDPEFAKAQLVLFCREWYMHPSGQLPAYEFAFSDVNPPVLAWAALQVYQLSASPGDRDRLFLERVFQKLMFNFGWWVNRKDLEGNHLFSGGFLGLDNIGVFDRSAPLPEGGHLEQADGTAWMAFYCVTMLQISLELASQDPAYEDVASKFFEHFVAITDAMNELGGAGLWHDDDGFYYTQLHVDSTVVPLRVRSMVGLIPLIACGVLEERVLDALPGFGRRLAWFVENRPDLAEHISYLERGEKDGHMHRLLAIPSRLRLERVLRYLLDETEFLAPFGLRSLSKVYQDHPYTLNLDGREYRVEYAPGPSTTGLFGGNSNWRGPIWFPLNLLLIGALRRYDHFYGEDFRIECPTGSGHWMTLGQVATELDRRLTTIFLPDVDGRRPCHGGESRYADDPAWRDLILFYECFDPETGRGIGASHQTGWTAMVSRCLSDLSRR